MPHGLKNWTYRDVIKFLKKHDFGFYEEKDGSHEAWIKADKGKEYIVEVNFIQAKKSYPPRTLETMIRQSGMTKKEWKNS